MKNNKFRYVALCFIVIIAFISIKAFTDSQERNLADVISYKSTDFYSFGFIKDINKVPEDKGYEWFTKDMERTDELMEFLSQYRVKKVSEETFNVNRKNEEKFEFTITHSKTNPAIVMAYESGVHVLVGSYYEVVNGPIDMEWIRNYH